MQLPYGPSPITLADYHAALASHRIVRTDVEVLTAAHKPVSGITADLLPGAQVNTLGVGAEVSRTLQLELYDPTHALHLDSDSPADGAIYADRFIRVTQTITSPLLAGEASVRAFTGPLVAYSRDGDVVSVEAQGKEQRARTDVPVLVCRGGMFVVDAIEKIMRERCGETRFSWPKGERTRLPPKKDVTVGRLEAVWPWPVCLRLARSLGMQLFYDGRGVLVLRDPPAAAVIDLVPLGPVTRDHDWTSVYNRVHVVGKPAHTSGKKPNKVRIPVVSAVAEAHPSHPFSPARMAVNGVPWTRTQFISNDTIATKAGAQKVANRQLASLLVQDLQLSATVIPVWHLDPLDLARVGEDVVQLEDASWPLTGGEATVGDTRRIRRPRR